jgi:hypothetical protein
MKFFSGFTLRNESHLFRDWLRPGDYTAAGFSYGAIKAAAYALDTSERIDTLQLFSPAFFQNRPDRFKRLQTLAFSKDPEGYRTQFLANCFKPLEVQPVERTEGSVEELEELLYYVWEPETLRAIAERGTRIEVYLGEADGIIDAAEAREFFTPFATVTLIKHANHFLQEQS